MVSAYMKNIHGAAYDKMVHQERDLNQHRRWTNLRAPRFLRVVYGGLRAFPDTNKVCFQNIIAHDHRAVCQE